MSLVALNSEEEDPFILSENLLCMSETNDAVLREPLLSLFISFSALKTLPTGAFEKGNVAIKPTNLIRVGYFIDPSALFASYGLHVLLL
eukprot:gene5728-10982_t